MKYNNKKRSNSFLPIHTNKTLNFVESLDAIVNRLTFELHFNKIILLIFLNFEIFKRGKLNHFFLSFTNLLEK